MTQARGPGSIREVLSLAWPICAALLGDALMGLVDTKLVGTIGAQAMGGVGLGASLMFLFYSAVFGLMRGVKVRTAFAVGEGRPEDGRRYAWAGVSFGVTLGLLVFFVGRDVGWALSLMGMPLELSAPAAAYFAAVSYGAPAVFVTTALVQHRQALGDTKSPMVVGLAGNVLNAVLAYGWINGHYGLPALGVAGAGLATASAQTAQALVFLVLLVKNGRGASRPATSFRTAVRGVLDLGLPTGLHFLAETTAFTTFAAILGRMGDVEMAGHQLALNVIRASFLPGIAIAEAACVLVGQSLGRERLADADRATRSALTIAVVFMAGCGLVFAPFGRVIAGVFTDDRAVVDVATRLLLVGAAFQVLDACNIVFRGALRGAKDVRVVALLGTTIVWTCVPTSAFVFGRLLGWGAVGGWLGFLFETAFSSVLFSVRWRRGAWRRAYAQDAGVAPSSGPVVEPVLGG